MPTRDKGVIRVPLTEAAVRPEDHLGDCELVSLARDTRLVADSIPEPAVYDRLIEIADELLGLALPTEKSA
jgi:hypothetical protein